VSCMDLDCCMEYSSSAVHQTTNKQKPSPLMVILSGVVGAGGGATPLVTGLDGVLNMRSVNEKVPLSTVISLKRLSSFQAAVSSSNSLPVGQHKHMLYALPLGSPVYMAFHQIEAKRCSFSFSFFSILYALPGL